MASVLLALPGRVDAACSGDCWQREAPATKPAARQWSSMTAGLMIGSADQEKYFMFGGWSGSANLGDTWTYSGADWLQHQLSPSPAARHGHTMAPNSKTGPFGGQIVLFGGASGSGLLDDTWVYAGSTVGSWTQKLPSQRPPARKFAAMARSSPADSAVLFGGVGASGDLNDTWVWDGTTWTQKFPATSPPARHYAGMATNLAGNGVVLFGGLSPSGAVLGDMWIWDGTTWTQQFPATKPSPRYGMAMGAAGHLFGGNSGSALLADTWEWTGSQWNQIQSTGPSAREFASGADNVHFLLFGGAANGKVVANTTWKLVIQSP